MMGLRDEATEAQVRAADPAASTWLAANAGSGKTRVLTDRVARLLLRDVDPRQILCLTYTKAAASEMQNRLFARLGEWAMCSDTELRRTLMTIEDDPPKDLKRARTLFANAIETPGGLKIQTIHSFCAGILRRFPLEAGVSLQFEEMEDRAAELLRAEIVDEMVESQDTEAVRCLTRYLSGDGISKLTGEIVRRQTMLENPHDWTSVANRFGLPASFGPTDNCTFRLEASDRVLLDRLIPALNGSTDVDRTMAAGLEGIAGPEADALSTLADVFLTVDGTPKKRNPVKAVRSVFPEVEAFIERVAEAVRRQKTLEAAQKTHALHQFAAPFLARYRIAKRRRGWLDYDDLILKTRELLSNPAVADWVLYRLDGGLSHILVDEAQDTSPAQWDVIRKLTEEMTSGQGAQPERLRTVFVVGDMKQSIYSFQGADPEEFDRMKLEFAAKLQPANVSLNNRSLEFSFRSSDAILRVVDRTFATLRTAGFTTDLTHRAFHADKPGRVDLWPVIDSRPDEDDRHWTEPVDRRPTTHHTVVLAKEIADRIADMLNSAAPALIPDRDEHGDEYRMRPVRPGDIMILMQTRKPLFHEIIRACKSRNLPIAGADRLRVGGELAVRDLIALLSFLSTPEDSLSLAVVLRSPLGGWSERQLFGVAHGRGKAHLWETLRAHRDAHPETVAMLTDLRRQIDFLRPYDLLERILTRFRGREKLLARLGPEAEDGIDALLSQALAYERSAIPSLTGFLRWAESDNLEIKRQVDSSGDLIRVITVHGAKGLEAPIVILPDCGQRDLRIRDELLETDGCVLWKTGAKPVPEKVATALGRRKEAEARERMRLLYVAMTRAETWLIVAAAGDLSKDGTDWYQTVRTGMQAAGAVTHDFAQGPGLRVEFGDWTLPPALAKPATEGERAALEPWFHKPLTDVPVRAEPLSPSDLGGIKALPSLHGLPEQVALARGTYVHRLLELMSGAAEPDWESIVKSVALPAELTPELISSAVAEARTTRSAPDLAWIFGSSALSEVTVTARVGGKPVLGTIDRLIANAERVTAVDFKTNVAVPETPERCPEGILRQMGAYAAALEQIYPTRKIETGILWTATGSYMPLPQNQVREAIARSPLLDGDDTPT